MGREDMSGDSRKRRASETNLQPEFEKHAREKNVYTLNTNGNFKTCINIDRTVIKCKWE